VSDTVPAIDPQRTALLVMDYQTGILGRLPDAEALLARAAEAIGIARDHGARIGYVRVAFTDEDFAAMPPTSRMGTRVGTSPQAYHVDSPATAIHDQIAPQPGDVVVRKTRVGAFSTTDLDNQLRGHDVDTLILAGISTIGVLLSTVRDASDRDYRVVVLADASADPEPDVHDFLIQRIFPRQADVIMLADLSGLLSAGAATGA
jgi:nicotinamidase-related amidase